MSEHGSQPWWGPSKPDQEIVESVVQELQTAGWTVESVTYGSFDAPVYFWGFDRYERGVEIIAYGNIVDSSSNKWRARILGLKYPPRDFWMWAVLPTTTPEGQSDVVAPTSLLVWPGSVGRQLREHAEWRADPRADLGALGDPWAAISVFALLGTFLGTIMGKSAEDAYSALKRALQRAPRATRVRGGVQQPWVVLHDVEFNTVLECPPELPVAAALQLASLAREGLERVHLRWNTESERWDQVAAYTSGRMECNPVTGRLEPVEFNPFDRNDQPPRGS
jgi:hypothetical protein